jgi:hypothetical protein
MKNRSISTPDKKRMVGFTSGEHLGVQEQIERRARELWCAGGCRLGTALNDWLQAEREVLEQFMGFVPGDTRCRNFRLASHGVNQRPGF